MGLDYASKISLHSESYMSGFFILVVVISLVAVMLGLLKTTGAKAQSQAAISSKQSKTKEDIAWESLPDEFVIFDLETTGLKTNKKPVDIVEISAVKVNKHKLKESEEVDTFTAIVKPWRGGLNPEATAINQITQRMIDEEGEDMSLVIQQFIEFVGDRLLIAYNVDFDRWFLQRELRDQGISKRFEYECALELAREAFPRLKNHKLTTVAAHLGINTSGAHRALNDCVMAMHVYLWSITSNKSRSVKANSKIDQYGVARKEELVGKFIVFTGTLPTLTRSDAEQLATISGMDVKSSVTKKVDFVVRGFGGGQKLERALELNLEVLTEGEFLELLKNPASRIQVLSRDAELANNSSEVVRSEHEDSSKAQMPKIPLDVDGYFWWDNGEKYLHKLNSSIYYQQAIDIVSTGCASDASYVAVLELEDKKKSDGALVQVKINGQQVGVFDADDGDKFRGRLSRRSLTSVPTKCHAKIYPDSTESGMLFVFLDIKPFRGR